LPPHNEADFNQYDNHYCRRSNHLYPNLDIVFLLPLQLTDMFHASQGLLYLNIAVNAHNHKEDALHDPERQG
jgi:hypothetical protein